MKKDKNGIYYFLKKEVIDVEAINVWYKLSDEYIDEFEKMILEHEEKEKIMDESLIVK